MVFLLKLLVWLVLVSFVKPRSSKSSLDLISKSLMSVRGIELQLNTSDQLTAGSSSMTLKFEDGEVKIYQPNVFHALRTAACLSEKEYICALSPQRLQSIFSDSKSNQEFWQTAATAGLTQEDLLTADPSGILVKSISHSECRAFRQILPSYANHVLLQSRHFNGSSIAAVLGLYRVHQRGSWTHKYYLVARNVFPPNPMKTLLPLTRRRTRYDLKGSLVGRRASKASIVGKDVDLLEDQVKIEIEDSQREQLLETISRDVLFLESHGFMDYSLLLGICSVDITSQKNPSTLPWFFETPIKPQSHKIGYVSRQKQNKTNKRNNKRPILLFSKNKQKQKQNNRAD